MPAWQLRIEHAYPRTHSSSLLREALNTATGTLQLYSPRAAPGLFTSSPSNHLAAAAYHHALPTLEGPMAAVATLRADVLGMQRQSVLIICRLSKASPCKGDLLHHPHTAYSRRGVGGEDEEYNKEQRHGGARRKTSKGGPFYSRAHQVQPLKALAANSPGAPRVLAVITRPP